VERGTETVKYLAHEHNTISRPDLEPRPHLKTIWPLSLPLCLSDIKYDKKFRRRGGGKMIRLL